MAAILSPNYGGEFINIATLAPFRPKFNRINVKALD
jgi:hypothetical protein